MDIITRSSYNIRSFYRHSSLLITPSTERFADDHVVAACVVLRIMSYCARANLHEPWQVGRDPPARASSNQVVVAVEASRFGAEDGWLLEAFISLPYLGDPPRKGIFFNKKSHSSLLMERGDDRSQLYVMLTRNPLLCRSCEGIGEERGRCRTPSDSSKQGQSCLNVDGTSAASAGLQGTLQLLQASICTMIQMSSIQCSTSISQRARNEHPRD